MFAIFVLPAELVPLFSKISKDSGWKKGMDVEFFQKKNPISCRIISKL